MDIQKTSQPVTAPAILEKLDPKGNPLIPTPTSDFKDPLNWTLLRKSTCLFIVVYSYFMLTYFTTAPIPSFSYLEEQLNINYSQVSWSFALPCLGLALGPLLVAVVASGCTSIKTINFGGYMAARFFQGLGAGPSANIGLVIIHDISFEHERGLRVGMWTIAANAGTVLGGVFGGLLATSGEWVAYHVTILFAVLLVVQFLFLPETLYPRAAVLLQESQKYGGDAAVAIAPVSSESRKFDFFNVKKVPGVPHPKVWTTTIQFFNLFCYPTIVISVLGYCFLQYWWICSISTLVPDAYINDSPRTQGLLLIGLLVGLLFAEVVCSGHLSDKLMSHLARKNGGIRVPEMRLWLGYPAAVVSSVGLVLWGVSVDKDWHWMVGQVAFFLYTLGLQTGNTVLSAYIVDNYPEHANEVITFYTVIINLSAFINPWFIYYWVEASGYTWTFAAQCIICSFGLIPLYILLQIYGVRLRSTRPMYTKHIDDMLEVPMTQVALGDGEVAVEKDSGDAV
ncbi:MFS transporter [Talaromyces pinophilus]|uniref:MFS transporter n=1 Tax=Talaromyces pinophilus TaxID=128442 RepID=A0A0B8N3G2_TALPI|nr:MFS transporter [Talaromyces pinophilus]